MNGQAGFAAALLDPTAPCPAGLAAAGADAAARFAVHRNNVVGSLVDVVAATFPVTLALVGRDFFRALARRFVVAAPPRSPVLADYGAGFADFVESFEPARSVPYLADVARLEWLRLHALHAADAEPLDRARLAQALGDPESLAAARLDLHPSLAVLVSPYAVFSLWAAHQGVIALAEVDPYLGERVLVVRDALEVRVIALAPGADVLLAALAAGAAFGAAAAQAIAVDPAFDLAAILAVLIRHGAFADLHLPRRSRS